MVFFFFLAFFHTVRLQSRGSPGGRGGSWRLVRTFDDHFPVAASCSVACCSEDYSAINHSGRLAGLLSFLSLSLSMVASWLFSSVGGGS